MNDTSITAVIKNNKKHESPSDFSLSETDSEDKTQKSTKLSFRHKIARDEDTETDSQVLFI